MKMMLNEGVYVSKSGEEVKVFEKKTVDKFTTRVTDLPYNNSRALGWDTIPNQYPSPCGQLFSKNSFGHTGYTGTLVWADKDKNLSVVALDNRVYPQPTQKNSESDMWWRNNLMNMIVENI